MDLLEGDIVEVPPSDGLPTRYWIRSKPRVAWTMTPAHVSVWVEGEDGVQYLLCCDASAYLAVIEGEIEDVRAHQY